MVELENNAFFWQKVDTLYFSSDLVIHRPRGSVHPVYSNLVYPVDYGYLQGSADEGIIECYKGTKEGNGINALVICADILKKDVEVKVLIGCTSEEEEKILLFLNQTDFQKTIIVRRGQQVPEWAQSGN